eukprot:1747442-Ditylum_brightwellii.AAC.1
MDMHCIFARIKRFYCIEIIEIPGTNEYISAEMPAMGCRQDHGRRYQKTATKSARSTSNPSL